MKTVITPETLPLYVDTFVAEIKQRGIHIVLLSGDLGSGKTTFTQTLAKALGITEPVLSPTFVLMKTYETTDTVFRALTHIDAYRIEDQTLFHTLRLKELLAVAETLFCIEWPDLIRELATYPHVRIEFTYGAHADERQLVVTYHE